MTAAKQIAVLVGLALALPGLCQAQQPQQPQPTQAQTQTQAQQDQNTQVIKNAREGRSAGRVLLFYFPNRIFDLLDFFRARVRVGPGMAVRARATEGVDIGLGSYAALYVGLPGPRQAVKIPMPLGLESYTGIELGPADAEVPGGSSPAYSPTEFGASVQALVAGFDLGVDPFELIDLLAGFALLDLRADDY